MNYRNLFTHRLFFSYKVCSPAVRINVLTKRFSRKPEIRPLLTTVIRKWTEMRKVRLHPVSLMTAMNEDLYLLFKIFNSISFTSRCSHFPSELLWENVPPLISLMQQCWRDSARAPWVSSLALTTTKDRAVGGMETPSPTVLLLFFLTFNANFCMADYSFSQKTQWKTPTREFLMPQLIYKFIPLSQSSVISNAAQLYGYEHIPLHRFFHPCFFYCRLRNLHN